MKSLLIVSFPRSMSSETARIIRRATGLMAHPGANVNLEILNKESPSFFPFPIWAEGEEAYQATCSILNGLRYDSIVKDVIQPELVKRYLLEHSGVFNTLFVDRPEWEIKACLGRRGWATHDISIWRPYWLATVDAVLPTERVLNDPLFVWSTLSGLGYDVQPFDYRDDAFNQKRKETEEFLASLNNG